MPIYDYKCPQCTTYREVIHGMTDTTIPSCPIHSTPMEKAVQSPGGVRVVGAAVVSSPYASVRAQKFPKTVYTQRSKG